MRRSLVFLVVAILISAVLLPSARAAAPEPKAAKEIFSVLDPRGNDPPVPMVPLAKRPSSLDGKTIYVLSEESTDFMIPWIVEGLKEKLPKTKVEMRLCPVANCWDLSMYDKGKDIVEKNADVVIHGPIH